MSNVKLVVFGSGSVGKSAISIQFVQGSFVDFYDPTICDVYKKQETIDGETYVIEVVDTAGQEEYAGLRSSYYQEGEGFIAVYNICDRKSFDEVQLIKSSVLRERGECRVPMVLMANKCDLELERKVAKKEGEALAATWFGEGQPIPFFESSAKDNVNIAEAFHEIVREVQRKDAVPEPAPAAHKDPASSPAAPAPSAGGDEQGKSKDKGGKKSKKSKDKKEKKGKRRPCVVM